MAGSVRRFGTRGVAAAALLAAAAVPSDAPPIVPSYDLTQTSYRFGTANHLLTTNQRGIKLPTGASALPAVTDDWFQVLFFSADEMTRIDASLLTIAGRGTRANNPSITNDVGLSLSAGLINTGVTPNIQPFSLGFRAFSPGNTQFFPEAVRVDNIDRGAAHVVVIGQKGDLPFIALVRVHDDGRVVPEIVSRQVGLSNKGGSAAGVNGWKYKTSDAAQYASGAFDLFTGFGASVDVADGSDRRAFGGSVGFYANIWGSFPFTAGLPDATALLDIAAGRHDGATLATLGAGTLRYANHLRGPANLAADQRGVIKDACTEIGTNAATPAIGAPLRPTPELTLRSYGDSFVFPMRGVNKQGSVRFAGKFAGTALSDSFEARLVRVDTGADLVPWTKLSATIDASAKTYAAEMPNVPAAIAFYREIRWRNRSALTLRDGDRQAVGMVVADWSQSQLALQGYAGTSDGLAGGQSLVPTQDTNIFLSVMKQPYFNNAQSLGGGPTGAVAVFRPYAAAQHGDGNIETYEMIRKLLGVPVMFIDMSCPGTHPMRHLLDRKNFNYTSFGTFAPDGAATSFSFTPASTEVAQYGATSANVVPGVVPGTFVMNVGTIKIVDDGLKNLKSVDANGATTGAITAGTINYGTGAITNLTFATAPASGVAKSGTFRYFALAPEIDRYEPETGEWSIWGEESVGLHRGNKTGRMIAHARRLRGVGVSAVRVFWYTAFEGQSAANVAAMFDLMKQRFEALMPAADGAKWLIGMPGRSPNGVAEAGDFRYGPRDQRAYVDARSSFARSMGEYLDMEIAGNVGPHQSVNLGTKTFGQRSGVGLAAAFATGLNVDGPKLLTAKFTDANRTAIELTYELPAGATSIVTADGSTTGLQGFRINAPGTTDSGWTNAGFTAAITAANKVTLTKSSGSWPAAQRVAFGNGVPVVTGGASTLAADNASLLKMPCDNDNTFAGQTKYTTRPGNLARYFTGVTVADAA